MDITFYHCKCKDKTNAAINTKNNTQNNSQNNTQNNTQNNNVINIKDLLSGNDKYELIKLDNDEHLNVNLELYQLTKEPSLDFIDNAMKFSYSNQGELIRQWKFTNSISISNMIFIGDLLPDLKKKKNPGNKNVNDSKNEEEENKKLFPYILLCYIDVQKLSDLNIPNDIAYTIRVYTSNTLAFIKDKTKEEHEKKLKEKWEENDEGRGQLALKSRIKFLVVAKNLKKEKLNENELKILNEERQRRTANEIDHIGEENDAKNNKNKKGKKNEIKQIDINKDKSKNSGGGKNIRNGVVQNNEEEDYSNLNMLNRNIIIHINKKSRPLSMENIIRQKRPISRGTKSKYILNFINYSNKERTKYIQKINKMPVLKNKTYNRNQKAIISDEKYRQKLRGTILTKFEKSENELKLKNENFIKISRDLAEGINNYNKKLNKQRRAESISKDSLINRRQKLQELIQRRFDIKKDILLYNEENKKILENFEKNKKDIINKKGDLINYEELYKIYKEGNTLLGSGDNDLVTFFNIISNIKEEEIKMEYERLKNTNDKNKDNIMNKMLEDLETYKWNINNELIEKLKLEVQLKNTN
jgi:hypothetical protein